MEMPVRASVYKENTDMTHCNCGAIIHSKRRKICKRCEEKKRIARKEKISSSINQYIRMLNAELGTRK